MQMATLVAGLKKAISDRTLTNVKDYHLPILVLMFAIGAGMAAFKPLSMSMAFVAFTGTIVAGITGQAFSPARRDDSDAPLTSSSPDPNSSPSSGK